MKIMTESGEIEKGYVDGYSVGERELEGCYFEITIQDDKVVAKIRDKDKDWFEHFSEKDQNRWIEWAIEDAEENGVSSDPGCGDEAWIEGIILEPKQSYPLPQPDTISSVVKEFKKAKATNLKDLLTSLGTIGDK